MKKASSLVQIVARIHIEGFFITDYPMPRKLGNEVGATVHSCHALLSLFTINFHQQINLNFHIPEYFPCKIIPFFHIYVVARLFNYQVIKIS